MKKNLSQSTILVISMGFLMLYLVFTWKWTLIASFVIGVVGIVSSTLSRLIEKGWMKLSHLLSYIIPSILLGIVFYFILFPISLISRLFTRDPLMLSNTRETYFVSIDKVIDKKDFEKTW